MVEPLIQPPKFGGDLTLLFVIVHCSRSFQDCLTAEQYEAGMKCGERGRRLGVKSKHRMWMQVLLPFML
jgi:hypothetical protein